MANPLFNGPGKVYIGTDVGADPDATFAVGSFTFLGAHEFDLLAPEILRVQGTCCRECGASLPPGQPATHEMGCLTPAVEQGRMTPRERQIKLLEAEEARDPEKRLRDLIGEAGYGGQRIESIRLGTKAWRELATTVPNGGALSTRIARMHPGPGEEVYYMGYPLVVDVSMAPDAMEVLRAKPNVPRFFKTISAARAAQYMGTANPVRGVIKPTVI